MRREEGEGRKEKGVGEGRREEGTVLVNKIIHNYNERNL